MPLASNGRTDQRRCLSTTRTRSSNSKGLAM
jgi:hypothetical protein